MTDVSIVMGAFGRKKEVRRTLQSYTKINHPSWELIFVNIVNKDTPALLDVYEEFSSSLPIKYFFLSEDESPTPANTWNYGISKSQGKFVITCSADILVPYPTLLNEYLDQYNGNRLSLFVYSLGKLQTNALDSIDWMTSPDLIKELPGFWKDSGRLDLRNTERNSAELHTFHTGMTRDRWNWFGKFRTEISHLVNDQDVVMRERALGVRCDTLTGVYGFHQCHPVGDPIYTKLETAPGWHYENERQARLLEPAPRDLA